jgi:hypothetical protein
MMGMKLGKRADASRTNAKQFSSRPLGLCTDLSQDSDGAHQFLDANLDRHSLLIRVICTCLVGQGRVFVEPTTATMFDSIFLLPAWCEENKTAM